VRSLQEGNGTTYNISLRIMEEGGEGGDVLGRALAMKAGALGSSPRFIRDNCMIWGNHFLGFTPGLENGALNTRPLRYPTVYHNHILEVHNEYQHIKGSDKSYSKEKMCPAGLRPHFPNHLHMNSLFTILFIHISLIYVL